jgi:hypothetical protein
MHTFFHSGTCHVYATVYTNCGSNSACRDVEIVHTSWLAELSQTDIGSYPNPANNELSITAFLKRRYRILTVTGINIKTRSLPKSDSVIALSDMTTGIYILEMTDKTGERNTIRFIKG